MFIGRRKFRVFLGLILVIISIIGFSDILSTFQLKQEIRHYQGILNRNKNPGFYDPLNIKQIPYSTIKNLHNIDTEKNDKADGKLIDWSKFAYVNYVSDIDYLCNTMAIFKKLLASETKAKLVLLVAQDLFVNKDTKQAVSEKLVELRSYSKEQVVIKGIELNANSNSKKTPMRQSLSKLMIFNETSYDRIIYMDNDALIRGTQTNFDELFFLPHYVEFAAPLTYWSLSEHKKSKCFNEVVNTGKRSNKINKYIDESLMAIKKADQYSFYNGLPNLPLSSFLSNKDSLASELLDATSTVSLTSAAKSLISFKDDDVVQFSTNFMVIKPKKELFETIYNYYIPKSTKWYNKNEIDIINDNMYNIKKVIYYQFKLFKKLKSAFVPSVMVLPAREYGLRTSSLKYSKHSDFIKNDCIGYYDGEYKDQESYSSEQKVVDLVEKYNKYIRLTDYPVEKPWSYTEDYDLECKTDKGITDEESVCAIWIQDFQTFIHEHKSVC